MSSMSRSAQGAVVDVDTREALEGAGGVLQD